MTLQRSSSRRCSVAARGAAVRNAVALWRCGATTRNGAVLWCGAATCNGAVLWCGAATRNGAVLWCGVVVRRCNSQRCGVVVRCCNSQRCGVVALRQRSPKFFIFFKSFTRQLQERKRGREKEKGERFETCFPALLVGITPAPSCQLPLAARTPTPCNSSTTNSSNSNNNSRIYKQKRSVAFNMKHRKWRVFLELKRKERKK